MSLLPFPPGVSVVKSGDGRRVGGMGVELKEEESLWRFRRSVICGGRLVLNFRDLKVNNSPTEEISCAVSCISDKMKMSMKLQTMKTKR